MLHNSVIFKNLIWLELEYRNSLFTYSILLPSKEDVLTGYISKFALHSLEKGVWIYEETAI